MTRGQDDVGSDFDVRRVSASKPDHEVAADGPQQVVVDLEVEPVAGGAWTVRFGAPRPGVRALDAVVSTPSTTGLCVVVAGTAFLGDVRDPATFHELDLPGPVVGMLAAPEEGVLLLHTPWSVAAIDRDGVRWVSGRLAIDGLRLDEVDAGWVRGVADPGDDEAHDLAVELATGRRVGGQPALHSRVTVPSRSRYAVTLAGS